MSKARTEHCRDHSSAVQERGMLDNLSNSNFYEALGNKMASEYLSDYAPNVELKD